jgi:hypothetical protein
MTTQERKSCFVIGPIGDPDTPERRRSDQVFKYIIAPVVEQLGYKPARADKIPDPGMITDQIIQRLLEDDLVVADLTGRNANVFYELAIRHAIRKPAVLLIADGEKIPFDVSQSRVIFFDHHDLDSVERCKMDLEGQISALAQNPDNVFSPVSQSVDLRRMRESDDPSAQRDAQIISMVQSLQSDISRLERRVAIARETPRIPTLNADPYRDLRYHAFTELADNYDANEGLLVLWELLKKWAQNREANTDASREETEEPKKEE